MIIVEGADNVGKSTLVKQLIELDPSLRLLHRPRFKPEQGGSIGQSYLAALTPPDSNVVAHANSIADRMLASECIYGKLYRGGCRMTPQEHFLIHSILAYYPTLVVFCNPPDAAILKSWREREQLYDRNPLEIAEAYRAQIQDVFGSVQYTRYDWTHESSEWWRKAIVKRHQSLLEQFTTNYSWGYGPCALR